ncbi:MAG: Crp/Fnr family transcriptional regulator [Muribaculaceae bacterium]|nr:Crp/Fnr family transcriptional regulator [Muribaculaceae bacterium]
MDDNNKEFYKALAEESVYPLTNHVLETLMDSVELINLRHNETLIDYQSRSRDLYFVKSGCIGGSTLNSDGVEKTDGFGLTGSLIMSALSYSCGLPSAYRYFACGPTQVYRLRKSKVEEILTNDLEFSRWLMGTFERMIIYLARRSTLRTGNAEQRYRELVRQRPDILNLVSDKQIASYLEITAVHLSRIKHKILRSPN